MDENSNRNGDFSNRSNSTRKTKTKLPKIGEVQQSTKEINIKNSFRKINQKKKKKRKKELKINF